MRFQTTLVALGCLALAGCGGGVFEPRTLYCKGTFQIGDDTEALRTDAIITVERRSIRITSPYVSETYRLDRSRWFYTLFEGDTSVGRIDRVRRTLQVFTQVNGTTALLKGDCEPVTLL